LYKSETAEGLKLAINVHHKDYNASKNKIKCLENIKRDITKLIKIDKNDDIKLIQFYSDTCLLLGYHHSNLGDYSKVKNELNESLKTYEYLLKTNSSNKDLIDIKIEICQTKINENKWALKHEKDLEERLDQSLDNLKRGLFDKDLINNSTYSKYGVLINVLNPVKEKMTSFGMTESMVEEYNNILFFENKKDTKFRETKNLEKILVKFSRQPELRRDVVNALFEISNKTTSWNLINYIGKKSKNIIRDSSTQPSFSKQDYEKAITKIEELYEDEKRNNLLIIKNQNMITLLKGLRVRTEAKEEIEKIDNKIDNLKKELEFTNYPKLNMNLLQ
ncbi:hypothetical protein KY321_02575, partial [Candidatus Woesearchaeota archaeon]|nr:hypothetical protein [Candidatus Woesearchaeota archaeon]